MGKVPGTASVETWLPKPQEYSSASQPASFVIRAGTGFFVAAGLGRFAPFACSGMLAEDERRFAGFGAAIRSVLPTSKSQGFGVSQERARPMNGRE